MKKGGRILALVLAILASLVIIITFAIGRDGRGIASYLLWKDRDSSGSRAYADVNGVRLYYEIHGKGEPLLLMHGGLGFGETLYGLVPRLSKRYMVIVPDTRGHGRSEDGKGLLHYDDMVEDMAALLGKLGIGRAYVAGWSDGGIVAIGLAIRHPGLVKAIVPIGANIRPDGLLPQSIEEMRHADPAALGELPLKLAYEALAPEPAHWPAFFREVNEMWLTEPSFTDEELRGIRCPALVMAGEKDEILDAHTRLIASLIPGSKLMIVPGATHELPMEKPDLVAAAMIDFLR
jgi:pimeloyl-ACP methyl ester carboxylesterase